MMIKVPLPAKNVFVSLVTLCLMRNFRVAPRDKEPITGVSVLVALRGPVELFFASVAEWDGNLVRLLMVA